MRLGQLSRKHNLKPTQIRDFIQNKFRVVIDTDPNTKLDDEHVAAIEKKFEIQPAADTPGQVDLLNETADQVKIEQEIVAGTLAEPAVLSQERAEPEEAEPETVSPEEAEPLTVPAADLSLENQPVDDPFAPRAVDPDAELIKAPKVKLEGLKVVGKIELPSKKAPETTSGETDKEQESEGKTAKGKKKTSTDDEEEEYSIYKDKRGIYHFSQQQRQNRKEALERRRLAQLEEKKKRSKANFYRQTVKPESNETATKKKKRKEEVTRERGKKSAVKPAPKGLWGRFIHWLNG